MTKKFLVMLFLFEFLVCVNCFADSNVIYKDREHGYYIDGRGQVPEYSRIEPPNPDKIPQFPSATRTVVPFEGYYDVNELGIRRNPNMTPYMPNHNAYYSTRPAHPYTKEEYVEVWCSGKKFENGIDCQSENYAITFVRANEWTFGVMKAPFKARKSGKQTAVFVMVDDLGLDAEAMHEVKKWGELFNMPIFFGTIDAYIPGDWII
ncbi:MAG: hypothetical protein K6A44_06775 [bacterium]|nr:hypothetical protein [bacterium]